MNNKQLNDTLQTLMQEKDFLTFLLKVHDFDGEYKKTSFYKMTKISLLKLIKYYKYWNLFRLEEIQKITQNFIDSLDLSNIQNIIDEWANKLETENSEIINIMEDYKDLVK